MCYRNFQLILAMAAIITVLPIAASAQSAAPPQKSAVTDRTHALRISSGDLLELAIFDTPELSGKLRVNEAGEVEVPIAGPLRVAGMTSEQAARAIETMLRSDDILKDPHASIFISEYATQGVTVAGEVRNPGIYPLLGSHGLIDLISAAGGATQTAGKAVTVAHRPDPEHPEVVHLETRPGSIAPDIDIRPGDTITVSRAGVVYVVGDVGKPGGFLIQGNEQLTAVQALALASGANRTAAKDKARLIRKTPAGREEFMVPLKSILYGKVIDIPLEDGDILFVPSSGGIIYAYRGVEAAIAITTGLIVTGRL